MNIPYTYSDIIALAYETGGLQQGDNQQREDYICENYFHYMTNKLLQLFNKRGI